jgi:outer membrane receptor protein involved in Fe transport
MIVSLGVNNITNNTMIRTTGFEQFRFDYEGKQVDRFPSSYYYAYGLNYMLNITFRI